MSNTNPNPKPSPNPNSKPFVMEEMESLTSAEVQDSALLRHVILPHFWRCVLRKSIEIVELQIDLWMANNLNIERRFSKDHSFQQWFICDSAYNTCAVYEGYVRDAFTGELHDVASIELIWTNSHVESSERKVS